LGGCLLRVRVNTMPNPADPTPRAPASAQSRWRWAFDALAKAATGARYPTMVFLVTRVSLLLLGYLTLGKFAVAPSIRPFPSNLLLDGFFRWDSDWYAHIVDQGYIAPAAIVAGQQRNTASSPVSAMRAAGQAGGGQYLDRRVAGRQSGFPGGGHHLAPSGARPAR